MSSGGFPSYQSGDNGMRDAVAAVRAGLSFETHRSAPVFVAPPVARRAAMLLSMRPGWGMDIPLSSENPMAASIIAL